MDRKAVADLGSVPAQEDLIDLTLVALQKQGIAAGPWQDSRLHMIAAIFIMSPALSSCDEIPIMQAVCCW